MSEVNKQGGFYCNFLQIFMSAGLDTAFRTAPRATVRPPAACNKSSSCALCWYLVQRLATSDRVTGSNLSLRFAWACQALCLFSIALICDGCTSRTRHDSNFHIKNQFLKQNTLTVSFFQKLICTKI